MRSELRSLSEADYWVYGVRQSDIQYTIDLVRRFLDEGKESLRRKIAEIRARPESEGILDEIQSDVAHYSWVEGQYLWQFCLWRLQGIFEALIIYTYLPDGKNRKLPGLRAKLEAAKEANLELSEADENALLLWNDLRNAISHAPPEQYRPIPFEESDLEEYASLITRIMAQWEPQGPAL